MRGSGKRFDQIPHGSLTVNRAYPKREGRGAFGGRLERGSRGGFLKHRTSRQGFEGVFWWRLFFSWSGGAARFPGYSLCLSFLIIIFLSSHMGFNPLLPWIIDLLLGFDFGIYMGWAWLRS